MKNYEIKLENMPDIKGLRFRGFMGETDYPHMVEIVEAHAKSDNDDSLF